MFELCCSKYVVAIRAYIVIFNFSCSFHIPFSIIIIFNVFAMASSKFEINRLSSSELQYLLAIRGVTDVETVKLMRQTLRNLFRMERKSEIKINWPDYPFSFDADKSALDLMLSDIDTLLDNFDGNDDSIKKKISTKINFALERLNNARPITNDDTKAKSSLLVNILAKQTALNKKLKQYTRSLVLSENSIGLGIAQVALSSSNSEISSSDSEIDIDALPNNISHSSNVVNVPKIKKIPVSQWNLKFTGEKDSCSLSAFLERIEDMRVARNATYVELFNSAIDLFSGKALIWYRASRNRVKSWSALVQLLRDEFQPVDYNDKLFDEIKNRTQSPDESIGMYIAVMTNLFNRLTVPVSEQLRLKILLKNISPFYQTQLGLLDIHSIDELLRYGRKLESCKASVESFKPPPSRRVSHLLEPDLAAVETEYNEPSTSFSRKPNFDSVESNITCYNCGQIGHKANACRALRRKRCYRCNKPNYTVLTCPSCSKNNSKFQGNAKPEH